MQYSNRVSAIHTSLTFKADFATEQKGAVHHERFPLPGPLPLAGEGEEVSLRDFCIKAS